jgi:translation initiation factor IF-3
MQQGSNKSKDSAPRINEMIDDHQIRLIDHTGENRGIVEIGMARNLAVDVGLDLVEISPGASPPVCKIMDFGKYKYEQQKKATEARKKQKIIEIKEIKVRPNIDTHDYDVKMKSMRKFLDGGDKVKITLRFRGREMAHQDIGHDLLIRISKDIEDIGKIESMPRLEGRQMVMMINPLKTS